MYFKSGVTNISDKNQTVWLLNEQLNRHFIGNASKLVLNLQQILFDCNNNHNMGSQCQKCKLSQSPYTQQLCSEILTASTPSYNLSQYSDQLQSIMNAIRRKYDSTGNNKLQQYVIGQQKLYRGLVINGRREGYGQYYNGSHIYFGVFNFDQPHGDGLIVKQKTDYIKGTFLNGKIDGYAVEKVGDKIFKGTYRDGGKVKGQLLTFEYNYQGTFKNNKFEGFGTICYENGDKYEGNFQNGEYHGAGKYTTKQKGEYRGQFRQGVYNGKGVYTWSQNFYYEGEYRNGKRNGFGKLVKNNKIYQGEWVDGQLKTQQKQKNSNDKLVTRETDQFGVSSSLHGLTIELF